MAMTLNYFGLVKRHIKRQSQEMHEIVNFPNVSNWHIGRFCFHDKMIEIEDKRQ